MDINGLINLIKISKSIGIQGLYIVVAPLVLLLIFRSAPITAFTADSVETKFFTKEKNGLIKSIKNIKYLPIVLLFTLVLLFLSVYFRDSWIVLLMLYSGIINTLVSFIISISIGLIILWQAWQISFINEEKESNVTAYIFRQLTPKKEWSKFIANFLLLIYQVSLTLFLIALLEAISSYVFKNLNQVLIFNSIVSFIISLFLPLFFRYGYILTMSLPNKKKNVWVYYEHKKWYINYVFQNDYLVLSDDKNVTKSKIKMLIKKEDIVNKELHIDN